MEDFKKAIRSKLSCQSTVVTGKIPAKKKIFFWGGGGYAAV